MFCGVSVARICAQDKPLGLLDVSRVFPYDPVILNQFATVAQLVEQGPLKPKVLGSTPSRRTTRNVPDRGRF